MVAINEQTESFKIKKEQLDNKNPKQTSSESTSERFKRFRQQRVVPKVQMVETKLEQPSTSKGIPTKVESPVKRTRQSTRKIAQPSMTSKKEIESFESEKELCVTENKSCMKTSQNSTSESTNERLNKLREKLLIIPKERKKLEYPETSKKQKVNEIENVFIQPKSSESEKTTSFKSNIYQEQNQSAENIENENKSKNYDTVNTKLSNIQPKKKEQSKYSSKRQKVKCIA